MRIQITGANGFVGKALVFELSAHSHELVLIDRPGSSDPVTIGVDITDSNALSKIDTGGDVDVVIHAAGLAHQFGPVTREPFWKVNVDGTVNVARFAANIGAKHLILISSVSVYGQPQDGESLRTEDSEKRPEGFYAESKLESEVVARKICNENGIALTILRLATVIGEGDRGNVARLIESIDRRRFFWIGRGENRKSLLYKSDIARACIAVLDKPTGGDAEVFNISGAAATMREIVTYIEDALGKKAPSIAMPPGLLKVAFGLNKATIGLGNIKRLGGTVDKWLSDETFSADKIKKVYGFEAETSVQEAIRREVAAYLKNK